MSWGQKGSGGNGPWGNPKPGSGGSGSGKTPPPNQPDLEEMLRKSQEQFKNMFGGGAGGKGDNKRATILMLALGGLLWLATGIYIVQADQQGVVLRFGEYHRTEIPGLHYHLPWPVETVYTPSVTKVNQVQIGSDAAGMTGNTSVWETGSLMLTGDMNIVDVNFAVQWKIESSATEKFLFNVRDAEMIVRPVAESAMREVIGQMPLDTILTTGQTAIGDRSKEIMQQVLDTYAAGIQVIEVNLSKPDVPREVIDAFQDVKRAEQEKNTSINKAESYTNDILPKARGKAVQVEQAAQAYGKQVTERAEGDVARFLSVYEQYVNAKDVTKKRMYLETMEEVLGKMNKFIIDGKSGHGLTPYLPLNEMNRKPAGGAQ
jgi:membrane protease subunit HflK